MKRNKFFAIMLIIVMIASLMVNVFAEDPTSIGDVGFADESSIVESVDIDEKSTPVEYGDIEGHWAKEMIAHLIALGVVNDSLVDADEFLPELKISRAETVELVLKSNLPEELLQTALKDTTEDDSFSDTESHSLKNYIELSKKFQIVMGYNDGTFRPDGLITREEFTTVLVKSQDVIEKIAAQKVDETILPDVARERWSHYSIATAVKAGILAGYTDGTFRPQKDITRAEAYTMLYNYYNICFVNCGGIVGFVSENGKLLEGIETKLITIDDSKVVQTVKSNKYSQFRFDTSGENKFKIETTKEDMFGIIPKVTTPLANALLKEILYLEKTVKVTGKIYSTNSSLLKNGRLLFVSDDLEFISTTDDTGTFNLRLLPNRTYKLNSVVDGNITYINDFKVEDVDLSDIAIKSVESQNITPPSGSGGGSNSSTTTYSLTVQAGNGGIITTGVSGNYKNGAVLNLVATPNEGYVFKNWSSSNGGFFANANSINTTFTMPSNHTTVTANFEQIIAEQILVDSINEFGTIVTNQSNITITGKIIPQKQISQISAIYQALMDEVPTQTIINGIDNWEIPNVPLEIGTNNVTINLKFVDNTSYSKSFVVNRVNEIIQFSDNVIIFDIESDDSDKNFIRNFSDNIIDFWMDDMGTSEDTSDDQRIFLLRENCELVQSLKDNSLPLDSIISVPPCDEFLAGLAMMIVDFGEPADFIKFPPENYELIYTLTPGIADIFTGDVSLDFSGGIDPENPIAFSLFMEGVDIYSVDSFGKQTRFETNQIIPFADDPVTPGMQWKNLKTLIAPQISANGTTSDIMIKFGGSDGVVVYDHDGKLEDTKNDQFKVGGEFGIKNLKAIAGVEWHPNFNPFALDLLPQQLISKVTYDNVADIFGSWTGRLSLQESIEDANKKLNGGFENKAGFSLLGMDLNVSGIDFKDCIILGALGLRLDMPPTYATLGTHQSTSKLVGISPVILIMPVIDITGKIEAKVKITYEYKSYVESGFNIQKKGYTGSYGPLENNKGQTSINLPFDRSLEIYSLEAKSKTSKNEPPASSLKISGEGIAEASVGAGLLIGLMMSGMIPAAAKGVVYARANAKFNGNATFSDSIVPDISGSGQLSVDVGLKGSLMAKLKVKTPLGDPGFDYFGAWEYHFLEYNMATMDIKGKVTETDYDSDTTNNPSLAGVEVKAVKKNVSNPPTYTAITNSSGEYVLENIGNGTYDVTFTKNGYISYTEKNVRVSTLNVTVNVMLDKESFSVVTGKILIADSDTDMSNNEPLSDAKIRLTNINSSSNRQFFGTSNSNGVYVIRDVTPGLYSMELSKSGYVTITQIIKITSDYSEIQNAVMELITVGTINDPRYGDASGRIIDALTGYGISNVVLNIRAGLNVQTGDILHSTTADSDGNYSIIGLPSGNYTIEAYDTSDPILYYIGYFNIKIVGGIAISNQDGVLTPIIPDGQLRIILRWGSTPSDLDSHLVGPAASGTDRFHVYYSDSTYSVDSIRYADLDVDDITSYGPETITIYSQTPGVYRYFIHDYTNRSSNSSMALANSGAYIEVYDSSSASPITTFSVPYIEGTLWAVFEYDSITKTITPINEVTYLSDPSYVGESYTLFDVDDLNNKLGDLYSDIDIVFSSEEKYNSLFDDDLSDGVEQELFPAEDISSNIEEEYSDNVTDSFLEKR